MKLIWASKPASAVGVAAVACAVLLGSAREIAAQDIPVMTVQIFNNETKYNIYPVYSTGISAPKPDNWLQAFFQIHQSEWDKRPFLKTKQFRFYVNPEGTQDNLAGGIPPRGKVIITVPLLTQQVATTNDNRGTVADQYIDWWGGGRIEIFMGPKDAKKPPTALTNLFTGKDWSSQTKIDTSKFPTPRTLPKCKGCQGDFTFFSDPSGLGSREPSQLIEFSFGAVPQVGDFYVLNPTNVDIDVSYVDAAFLPAAIASYNPSLPPIAQSGYVGSTMSIDDFQCGLTRFLGLQTDPTKPCYLKTPAGKGWPQFIDRQGNTILKVPSLVNLLGRNLKLPQADLTAMQKSPNDPWPPLADMRALWNKCLPGTDSSTICKNINIVRTMFKANYDNYFQNYKKSLKDKCDQTKDPIVFSEDLMIGHVYGFTPFTEGCATDANLLADTPGYADDDHKLFQTVKNTFDTLMSWPTGEFAPYVGLIHDDPYLNIPNVYAYSVDDAMGNLQIEGQGMIIAVGGPRGLPNKKPAQPPVTVGIGFGKTDKTKFTHYGICTLKPDRPINPDFPAFDVSLTKANISQCPISLKEDAHPDLVYVIKLKQPPPFTFEFDPLKPFTTKTTTAVIDCSGNAPGSLAAQWCITLNDKKEPVRGVYAYSEHPPESGRGTGKHHVITAAPQQPPP